MLHIEHNFDGAENYTIRKVEHKYLGGFEMWLQKRMKIRWT